MTNICQALHLTSFFVHKFCTRRRRASRLGREGREEERGGDRDVRGEGGIGEKEVEGGRGGKKREERTEM